MTWEPMIPNATSVTRDLKRDRNLLPYVSPGIWTPAAVWHVFRHFQATTTSFPLLPWRFKTFQVSLSGWPLEGATRPALKSSTRVSHSEWLWRHLTVKWRGSREVLNRTTSRSSPSRNLKPHNKVSSLNLSPSSWLWHWPLKNKPT